MDLIISSLTQCFVLLAGLLVVLVGIRRVALVISSLLKSRHGK